MNLKKGGSPDVEWQEGFRGTQKTQLSCIRCFGEESIP